MAVVRFLLFYGFACAIVLGAVSSKTFAVAMLFCGIGYVLGRAGAIDNRVAPIGVIGRDVPAPIPNAFARFIRRRIWWFW